MPVWAQVSVPVLAPVLVVPVLALALVLAQVSVPVLALVLVLAPVLVVPAWLR